MAEANSAREQAQQAQQAAAAADGELKELRAALAARETELAGLRGDLATAAQESQATCAHFASLAPCLRYISLMLHIRALHLWGIWVPCTSRQMLEMVHATCTCLCRYRRKCRSAQAQELVVTLVVCFRKFP